jgi:hypothetical protein
MKYLNVIIFLVVFILLISYYLTIRTTLVETFLPPAETSISNDIELKKYFNYVYSEVSTASDNCEKIGKISDLVTSYLSILYNQTKTEKGLRTLKKTYPAILGSDVDIDKLVALYISADQLPTRGELDERKDGRENCHKGQVHGGIGNMENCVNILEYFYSKPNPPTAPPTQAPATYGAPPPSIDITTEENLRKFIETAYITITQTQTSAGGVYSDCAKMNWCSIWIPAALTPIVENYSFNELLLNYPNILSNVYDVDAFYSLVLSSNNLAGVSNDCESENSATVNSSLQGTYMDVIKYIKYFFGKPEKVLRPPGGDLNDTHS